MAEPLYCEHCPDGGVMCDDCYADWQARQIAELNGVPLPAAEPTDRGAWAVVLLLTLFGLFLLALSLAAPR